MPAFNADSAYAFVAQQVAFGPRVPGSQASQQTAQWLVSKLKEYGAANITEQKAVVPAYNGDRLPINNISASFNPQATRRVLLLSHWDSRPWADHDSDPAARRLPIDGANDGASGVGVILEIARQIAAQTPQNGVDVLFVDAEDYGRHADDETSDSDETWCLGTQFWIENPTVALEQVSYAVLLDMVGGKDAVFNREYFSEATNPLINNIIWKDAKAAGFADRFSNEVGNPIMDDHVYLIRAGIPAIDIIESANPLTGSFNPTWHTRDDNMDNIDRETLRAVGQTLMNVIYKGK